MHENTVLTMYVCKHARTHIKYMHVQKGHAHVCTHHECEHINTCLYMHGQTHMSTHIHAEPTLCLVAISFPCSRVIFLKCIRSTLLATRIMGKDSLGRKHRVLSGHCTHFRSQHQRFLLWAQGHLRSHFPCLLGGEEELER